MILVGSTLSLITLLLEMIDILVNLCIIYFDDILIYSPSEADHLQHLREVFMILQKMSCTST